MFEASQEKTNKKLHKATARTAAKAVNESFVFVAQARANVAVTRVKVKYM